MRALGKTRPLIARDRERESFSIRLEAHGGRGNLLLDTAAAIVAGILAHHGFALAAPVATAFQVAASGSSGVDVTVKLEDPSEAAAATAAIHEHFGEGSGVDIVNVS